MFGNPTSLKYLRSVRNWYDARRRVVRQYIQEMNSSKSPKKVAKLK